MPEPIPINLKWKRKAITLRLGDAATKEYTGQRKRLKQVLVLGNLAVHGDYRKTTQDFSLDVFTVTHVPTSMAVRKGLTKQQAMALAYSLAELDWTFHDVAKIPEATRVEARRIIFGEHATVGA
jgi:hypothetical protein